MPEVIKISVSHCYDWQLLVSHNNGLSGVKPYRFLYAGLAGARLSEVDCTVNFTYNASAYHAF